MKIYVAGTVPRAGMEPTLFSGLEDTYRQITVAVRQAGHTAQLPLFEDALAQMETRTFQEEIHRRIRDADSVITILDPPSLSVAFEAHFAAGAGKPQAILVEDPANPPPGVRELMHVHCYALSETSLRSVVQELAAQVAAKPSTVAPPASAQASSPW